MLTIAVVLAADVEVTDEARGAAILCALGALSERQRFAFVCHELNGETFDAIAPKLGVHRARVQQLVREAEQVIALDLALWADRMAA